MYIQAATATAAGGIFNMYGGEICGNKVSRGGAVSMADSGTNANPNQFNMYGGKIYGNEVVEITENNKKYGGSGGAVSTSGSGIINIAGGQITDNIAEKFGAAIYITEKASLTVSGNPVVKNNKAGDKENNLYVGSSAVFTVGQLTSGAQIGLSRAESRDSDVVSANTITEAQLAFFSSDSDAYELKLEGDKLALAEPPAPPAPTKTHKLCGDETCTQHEDVVFQEWDKTDSLPTAAGNYYLKDNVTLTAVVSIEEDVVICLNGKTITQTKANTRVMNIASGATVTITDCGTTGTITGGSGTYGAAIGVRTNSVLNMYAGKITGNVREHYQAEGTVYIQAATATAAGGIFNMYGGEICGNKVSRGGAVSMADSKENANPAQFNMYGGKIYGNEVVEITENNKKYGGCGGAVSASGSGIINIAGGQITGNTAQINGAGIYILEAATLTFSGDAYVMGNKVGQKLNNVYLKENAIVHIGSSIAAGMQVGISAEKAMRAISNQVDATLVSNFVSDVAGNEIVHKNGCLYLEKKTDHKHCVCDSDVTGCDHSQQNWYSWDSTTSLPETSGYYYLTADVQLQSAVVTQTNQQIFLCLNGKTVTTQKRHLTIASGTVFTITDCMENAGGFTGGKNTYGGSINVNSGATLNLYAGNIYGNASENSEGGAIYMQGGSNKNDVLKNGAIFNMYGGVIRDNVAAIGGAVRAAATNVEGVQPAKINIFGGQITGNQAKCVVTVDEQTQEETKTLGYGGAIAADGGAVVNVSGGVISGNKAELNGGAIYLKAKSQLNITGGNINANTAEKNGGAVAATGNGTVITMTNGRITGNSAASGGAVLLESKSAMNMQGGQISGNTATFDGAGLYASNTTKFTMADGQFTENKAGRTGGAMYGYTAELTLNGGLLSNNEAQQKGGAMGASAAAKLMLAGVKITENTSGEYGGAIYVTGEDTVLTVTDAQISGNSAVNGGAVLLESKSVMNLQGGVINGNTSSKDGGAIYASANTTLNMTGGTITGNQARSGGGVYGYKSVVNLQGGKIVENIATRNGGGVSGSGDENKDVAFKIGGALQITDNKVGDKLNNLYLANDQIMTITDMADGAKVGISVNKIYRAISNKTEKDYTA